MRKWIVWTIVALSAALLALAVGLWWYVFARPVFFAGFKEEALIKVLPGKGADSVILQLEEAGIRTDPTILKLAFQYFEADKNIRIGRYLIKSGKTLRGIVSEFASGNVQMGRITQIEGTESKKFIEKVLSSDDFEHPEALLNDADIMTAVGAPEETHPEGQFAADTFIFAKGIADSQILRQAYREQQKRIRKAWDSRDPDLKLQSPYELLILASLIEKETGKADERALVSSVFHNRLKKGMMLQTDPSVVYGVSDFQGKILRSHLKTDTPYNTYTRTGLPPTPICNPGAAAIEAAAHPAKTDFLYFVAKGNTGESHFSSSLPEHNAAVQKYLRSQENKNPN